MEPAESLSCLVCVFAYLINLSETTNLLYTIPESKPTYTVIGNIANDSNIRAMVSQENFSNLEYFFLTLDQKYEKYVAIDSITSNLTVKDPLDREAICDFSSEFICSFSFEVAARSKIDTVFIKIAVTLEIEDVNDNPPTFEELNLALSVSEADVIGKSIKIDGATDLDSSNYSVKSYELSPSSVPFEIVTDTLDNGASLKLVIIEELDREKVDRYSFDLIAYDGGDPPLHGAIAIDVTVEDANDNNPVFPQNIYNVNVTESFPVNKTFLTLKAVDDDIGENAQISYRISKQQSTEIHNTFAVNSSTGELYLMKTLVYRSEEAISVKVDAVDHGSSPLSSTTTVKVFVEDSVNVRPEISLNLLSQSNTAVATEYASIGTVVAYVKVTDNDGGRNGMVTCNINNSEYFETKGLELKEYKVIVRIPLDRETIEKHNVTVTCYDNGIPSLTASANFAVTVTDENDNAPVFAQNSYEAVIVENNEENYTIVQVHAEDADSGNNAMVSYYINPEYRQNFSINAKSGLVKAKIRFDRETKSSYEIAVTAVDMGNPQMSSNITIYVRIKDENDNEPIFERNFYEYFTPESDLDEIVLGKVIAHDKDEGANGFLSYSLVGNYSELPFEVLPDGTVKSTKMLDREQFSKYDFQVMAIDSGIDIRRSSIANVTVYVKDINDNAPVISFPNDINFVKYITYMTPADTQIMKIEAHDADYGQNAELSYTVFARNDSDHFRIGKKGEVIVARKLTDDDISLYFLDVLVSDQGTEPKSVTTKVNIEVLAKNVTTIPEPSTSFDQQHVIIAVVVVVVTLVIAAAILVLIWVIRRHDLQKRKYLSDNNNHVDNLSTGFSSNDSSKLPDTIKAYKSSLLPPTYPVLATAPPPEIERSDLKPKDVKFQEPVHSREKSGDSTTESTNQKMTELHRLASIRLHQAIIQNQDKQYTSQSELNQDGSKEGRKQEDIHSDMSADTATYDSGIGGSVSDTGDCRLSQLQSIVRQSGRRGKPPHAVSLNHQTKAPKIIARGRSCASDIPPERPPPLKLNPYKITPRTYMPNGTKSPVRSPVHFSPPVSPTHFSTSSPTPCSVNQNRFLYSGSPSKVMFDRGHSPTRQSPSVSVVQDLLMYKKFQNGLRPPNGHLTIDESVDTTQFDDDGSSTSGSYYIDNPAEDWRHPHPPVSDIYV